MWNRSENQIKLVLIRHGETRSNKEHRYLGRTDECLSEEGIEKLQKAVEINCYPKAEYLFISPMRRCLQTAGILYPAVQPVIIPEWEEMDFGVFEGKNYLELQGDGRYQAWIDSNGMLPFPEGESREAFMLRCDSGFQRMVKQLGQVTEKQGRMKTAAMIVHGGTIMSLLSRYCGGDYYDYQVQNGDGYTGTLEISCGKLKIVNLKKLMNGIKIGE